jgi:hypothetical protein
VFGGNMPDESEILVQYGPCRKDNFGWALDPANSCGNGCNDPYADAPITWTFQDGSVDVPPNFDEKTQSHMPQVQPGHPAQQGLLRLRHVHPPRPGHRPAEHHRLQGECSMPNAVQPCDNGTQFINILITDGQTTRPNQYNPPLMQMNAAGIKTYVIGFGDGVDSPQAIASMNDMGLNGWHGMYYDANNQASSRRPSPTSSSRRQLRPVLLASTAATIIPEPTSIEPDPLPDEHQRLRHERDRT